MAGEFTHMAHHRAATQQVIKGLFRFGITRCGLPITEGIVEHQSESRTPQAALA
jgi:hypothetical protein